MDRVALIGCLWLALSSCSVSSDEDPDPIPAGTYRLVVQQNDLVNARTRGGTLFSLRSPNGTVVAAAGYPSTWNTYCANTLGELHFYVRTATDQDSIIQPLEKPDIRLHSGHAFSREGALHVDDLGTGRQYRLSLDSQGQPQGMREVGPESKVGCAEFVVAGTAYRWAPGEVQACTGAGADETCDNVAIDPSAFPYDFAEHDGVVLVTTNWGEVLIRNEKGWCRALEKEGIFRCPTGDEGPVGQLLEPRGFQFYSSTVFQGRTLLGRWPDGLIYEFDGVSLKPSGDLPPAPTSAGLAAAMEAQSMAVYCGDLYVGYWPRGEIWMKSGVSGHWKKLGRVFTHPIEDEPPIPYLGREPAGADWAFLGQRVTSFSLLGDSLYASTSNLRGWSDAIEHPEYLTPSQVAEYGTLHRIHANGCLTVEVDPASTSPLVFDIAPTFIRVRRDRTTVAQIPYAGTIPQGDEQIQAGDGLFGKMADVSVVVQRSR